MRVLDYEKKNVSLRKIVVGNNTFELKMFQHELYLKRIKRLRNSIQQFVHCTVGWDASQPHGINKIRIMYLCYFVSI